MPLHRSLCCRPHKCVFFVLIELLFLLIGTAEKVELLLTPDKPTQSFLANRGTTYTMCSSEHENFNLMLMFHQIKIRVISSGGYKFPWHSIKGLSTDDCHSNIQGIVYDIFGTEEEKAAKSSSVEFPQSFIRDIVSACPSPLLHSDRTTCPMSFSPFGESCVQLRTDTSVQVTATIEREINFWLPFNLVLGTILLNLAQPLSKSSIFQYSSGVFIFIAGGILVITYFASKRAFTGRHDSSSTQMTGMTALLAGSYGASAIVFLKSYLRTICLKYAEFGLAYVGVMACLGLAFVRFVRNMEGTKHLLRVGVKWLLRLAGVVTVFRSSASPAFSLGAVGILLVLYIVLRLLKKAKGGSTDKDTKKKR